jgi:tRNA threonylcarbamoyladenosine biosynthesis protein TsaB
MLLLVTDTSGKQGFVALARAKENSTTEIELIASAPLEGGTFSAQLVPQIAGLLAKNGFSKNEIGAFVVVSGPGSFTGLRVGLAAIKALAEILHKPIVAVSLLEAIAVGGGGEGKIVSAIDAGRGEVYVGEYEIEGGDSRCLSERLLTREEFASVVRGANLATPVQSWAQLARDTGATVSLTTPPDAAIIARLGLRKLHAGEVVAPEQLEANYIRRDAAIFGRPVS